MRLRYTLAADGKTLVPDATEQEAIRLMQQLRAAGESYRDIAAEWNGRKIDINKGGAWQPMTVRNILARAA